MNTEFIVKGKEKTAEELGFNTDINKAQEITKNKEENLDIDLHTDLLNKKERDKIVEAGEKIGGVASAIVKTNDGGVFNTYKENRYGTLFNKYASDKKDELSILGDPSISELDKKNVLNEMIAGFLRERCYKGDIPEILIGTKTEAVDSTYEGKELIFISKEVLNSKEVLSILGHELGHLNTYDSDEKTANTVEGKIKVVVNPTEKKGEHKEYIEELKDKYEGSLSEKEGIKLQESIPDEYKEQKIQQAIRSLNVMHNFVGKERNMAYIAGHQFAIITPDDQSEYFESGKLKKKYKELGYPEPVKIGENLGWTLAGHKDGKALIARFNEIEDIKAAKDLITGSKISKLRKKLNPNELYIQDKTDTETINKTIYSGLIYNENTTSENFIKYNSIFQNCNTWFNSMIKSNKIENNITDFKGYINPGADYNLKKNFWELNKSDKNMINKEEIK